MYAYKVDSEGYIVDSYVIGGDVSVPDECITVQLPQPLLFYRPKWNGTKWIEGATQEEIDEITKVEPSPPTETEQTIELLKKQNLALSKMNTQLSNTNAELKKSIALHDGIISELVLKMFDEDIEVSNG
ncbi:hypothetical protein [Lysinibacillus sp. RS5]|uniref:hypothetical protein n=1 Tax=unclassified Lysinibacillus TaxID=2636778 RepID=UPI0035BE483B